MDYLEAFGVATGQGKYHEEAVYGLALVYTVIHNEIAVYLDRYDLTPAKMNALMIIKHQGKGKGISQVDIGNRLMVTASNMTRLLDKLERDGLIARSAQVGDRRVNVIKITPKGARLLDRVWPGYQEKIKGLTNVLSAADQKAVSQLLSRWLERIKDANKA